jgi:hypothetical protein
MIGLMASSRRRLMGSAGMPISNLWRLWIHANQNSGNWPGLGELQMRGAVGGLDQTTGGTASADYSHGSHPASFAFDDNIATVWKQGNHIRPAPLRYQFASPVGVEQIAISCPAADHGDLPTVFDLDYWNGTAWRKRAILSTPGNWQSNETRLFTTNGPCLQNTGYVFLTGDWDNGGTIAFGADVEPVASPVAYSWKVDGVVRSTDPTFTGTAADNGKTLSCDAIYSLNGISVTVSASRVLRNVGILASRWRLRSVGTQYFTISEAEFRRNPGMPDQCNGGTAVSSSNHSGSPANVFDNNTATNWHSGAGGDSNWIEYQFPSPVAVNQVQVNCRTDDPNSIWQPSSLRLEYWDGSTWIQKQVTATPYGWSHGKAIVYDFSA